MHVDGNGRWTGLKGLHALFLVAGDHSIRTPQALLSKNSNQRRPRWFAHVHFAIRTPEFTLIGLSLDFVEVIHFSLSLTTIESIPRQIQTRSSEREPVVRVRLRTLLAWKR